MTKSFFASLLFLCLSCTSTNFVFDNPSQTGVDFSKGKWLINEINVPYYMTAKLTEKVQTDFRTHLGERMAYAPEVSGLLMPQKEITLNPTTATLKNLYLGTGYDYFINLKAYEIKNDFSAMDLTNHRMKSGTAKNQCEVAIEFYDLKNALVVYSQKVTGSVHQSANKSDFNLSRTQGMIVMGAYNRLMADITKKSVH